MGILDNLTNLLKGSATRYVEIPLAPSEVTVLDKVGCLIKQGAPWIGGQLRLTTDRLLFRPWDTSDLVALLDWGLSKAGAPDPAVTLVGWLQAQNQAEEIYRDVVMDARAGRDPSLARPPTILVTLADGRSMEFGILKSLTSPNGSRANSVHRDELLTALQRK